MRAWKSIAALVISAIAITAEAPVLAGQAPATPAPATASPQAAAPPTREQWQRLPDVFRELGASPGRHIADIGAGSGFFTTRLAKAVGPEGRVYAVDVNPISLRELKDALGADTTNVELIRGDENDPHLPAGRLDGALVVNAYHEFAEYDAMLRLIKVALKPDGRLVLIEPIPRADTPNRAAQVKRHTIAIETVEEDLRRNGFEIVTKDPVFVTRPEHQHQGEDAIGGVKPTDWLLVARPRAGSPLF